MWRDFHIESIQVLSQMEHGSYSKINTQDRDKIT
jgi:hypothetical protein